MCVYISKCNKDMHRLWAERKTTLCLKSKDELAHHLVSSIKIADHVPLLGNHKEHSFCEYSAWVHASRDSLLLNYRQYMRLCTWWPCAKWHKALCKKLYVTVMDTWRASLTTHCPFKYICTYVYALYPGSAVSDITKNFQLGFGSFVDKRRVPYISVETERFILICVSCVIYSRLVHNIQYVKWFMSVCLHLPKMH